MTNKELLKLAIDWFKTGANKASRLNTGKLSHDKASLQGQLLRSAEFLERHLNDE
jgi:hypothetical protein